MDKKELQKLLDGIVAKGVANLSVSFTKAAKVDKLSKDEVKKLFTKNKLKFVEGDEERVIPFLFTDATPDRHNEVVLPKGVDLKEFRKNPAVLFMHNSRTFPIGTSIKTEFNEELDAVVGHVFFMDDERDRTGVAETTFRMIKAGTLKAGSIGFSIKPGGIHMATDDELKAFGLDDFGLIITQSELTEFSVVTVGANPAAGVIKKDASSEGIFKDRDVELLKIWNEIFEKAGKSGVTGKKNDHDHPFKIDEKGTGTANKGQQDHTHKIIEFSVKGGGTDSHSHSLPKDVKPKNVEPESTKDTGLELLTSLKDLESLNPEKPEDSKTKEAGGIDKEDTPSVSEENSTGEVLKIEKSFVVELMNAYVEMSKLFKDSKIQKEAKTEVSLTESFMKDVVNMKRGSVLTKDEVGQAQAIIDDISNLKVSLEDLLKNAPSNSKPKSSGDPEDTPTDRDEGSDDLNKFFEDANEKLNNLTKQE